MDIGLHAYFQISVFTFSGKISENGLAESYDSLYYINFLRYLHTVFHFGCTEKIGVDQ